jgi:hypothetical protein
MQRVATESEEFECWAFKTEKGKYHLAYMTIDGTKMGFMADDPVPEEKIPFASNGEIRVFDTPFCMELGEEE